MDQTYQLLNTLLEYVEKVADKSGIVKCILIAQIYETIKALEQECELQFNQWKEEKLKYEAEILDLKEILATKKE